MRFWVALAGFPPDTVRRYLDDLCTFVSEVTVEQIRWTDCGWVSLIEFDAVFVRGDQGTRIHAEVMRARVSAYAGWIRDPWTGAVISSLRNDAWPALGGYSGACVGEFCSIEIEGLVARVRSDHYATHPVYYWRSLRGTWVAGNDVRLLFLMSDVPLVVRRDACESAIGHSVLVGENELVDGQTFFEGISKLTPATVLTVERDGRERRTCSGWCETFGAHVTEVGPDYVEQFREVLNQCVADRVGAGAGGLMLSGGVDSNTVLGASLSIGSGAPYCVNVSFEDPSLPMSQDDKLVASGMSCARQNRPGGCVSAFRGAERSAGTSRRSGTGGESFGQGALCVGVSGSRRIVDHDRRRGRCSLG
jgi:asparagine synthase (glutamine-hydrolysing)